MANEKFRSLGQMPVFNEDVDMGDLAEQANDVGIAYYQTMHNVRQALLNIVAASVYHLFEQQFLLFHRRELLDRTEENNRKLFEVSEARRRLEEYGIDCTSFKSWAKLGELRLVANVVKHAEGPSSQELHGLRPDLFVYPSFREERWAIPVIARPVFMPLAGEDIYVTAAELASYFDAVVAFWNELADEFEKNCQDSMET